MSNSKGWGRVRRLLPDDDSGASSGCICRWGVMVDIMGPGADCGGVRSWGRDSEPWGDGSGGAVIETLPLRGGG